uniref:Uncharacterized protein n=1 Tax=Setaria italica TaxID=4555 RepID=K3XTX3_SETIT
MILAEPDLVTIFLALCLQCVWMLSVCLVLVTQS